MKPDLDAVLMRWLESLPGQNITHLIFACFVFDNKIGKLQEIGFEFGGSPAGTITCASDGESLRYVLDQPTEADLGEYGARKLFDELEGIDTRKLLGVSISGVDLVLDNAVHIGIVLKLLDSAELIILNCGDDLVFTLDSRFGLLLDPAVTRHTFS